jgi:hypothetical protein
MELDFSYLSQDRSCFLTFCLSQLSLPVELVRILVNLTKEATVQHFEEHSETQLYKETTQREGRGDEIRMSLVDLYCCPLLTL